MLFCNKCHNFYEESYEEIRLQFAENGDVPSKDKYPIELFTGDTMYTKHLNKLSGKPECGECKDNLIEIDVEIAPLLTALWEKGYETLFSCSGHNNAPYAKPKYYELNAYILIDASKFTDEFINKIMQIMNNDYNNMASASIMYSTFNNIQIKCISLRNNTKQRELSAFRFASNGFDSIPPCDEIVSAHAYTLLCQIRKEISAMIERLPVVSDSDLKKSDNDEIGNDYSLAYNKLWVDRQLEKFPKARRDVLTFISAVDQYSEDTKVDNGFRTPIEKLFSSGFCYYFAIMLRDAFGGKIVLKFHDGVYPHMFWMDENEVLYDIYGVYEDCNPKECIPIEEMDKETLEEFRHIPRY